MSHERADAGVQAPAPDPARLPRPLALLGRLNHLLTGSAMAVAAAGVLLSLGLLGWSVLMRYGLNRPPVWVDQVVGMLLVATVMGAAAQVLRRGEHLGVDIFTERLSPPAARWASVWSSLATLMVAAVLVINGAQTAMQAREFGVMTEGHLEIPVWPLMLLMPAGGLLMALVAIEALWRLALGLPPVAGQAVGAGHGAGPAAAGAAASSSASASAPAAASAPRKESRP